MDGSVKKGDRVLLMVSGKEYVIDELAILSLNQNSVELTACGEVGYLGAAIKAVADARVGDTITLAQSWHRQPCHTEAKPMVFCGLFPIDADQFPDLREALEKLDERLAFYEPETSMLFGSAAVLRFAAQTHGTSM